MKKYSAPILAACALFALGGCATTSSLTTSTETDGVYYSSKDQTTLSPAAQQALSYNQSAAAATDADGDVNPEYNSNAGTAGSASSTEYYDNDYSYAARLRRFNQPTYNGLGLGYYGMAYTDPFYYGGYSPYGYNPYSAIYDPFYSPYGYGSGLSLSLGLGFGSFYRPYYGYGYSPYSAFYDPFYSPYYGAGYGGLGYGYGLGSYYGGYPAYGYGYGGGGVDRYSNNVRRAPRHDRSAEALSSNRGAIQGNRMSGNMTAPNATSGNVVVDNNGNRTTVYGRRGRIIDGGQTAAQSQNATPGVPADQPSLSTNGRGSRWRVLDQNNGMQPGSNVSNGTTAAPERRSRARFFDNGAQQQQQQQTYSRPSRSFEQPSRSFEQPSRSFSTPSSSPSFSTPSGGGGGSRGRVR